MISFWLLVTILDAHDLPAMDRNGMSDPYVKLSILPERKQKYETKIIRNTLNPIYNETFLFSLPFNELQSKTLSLTVYDYDRLSKDDKMGQLSIPLESIDFGTTTEICQYLNKPENDDDRYQKLQSYRNTNLCRIACKFPIRMPRTFTVFNEKKLYQPCP
ncbi:C2 domain protein [Dictyocaulus viviparus]|uniref:C2 domain protein n=1 Tax=Dictyocaulus viviparus TaxID=29172 RepID=A0A0D8Y0M9_DICVI|nr:C2 domain protein [Dictyocaulus viviparus]